MSLFDSFDGPGGFHWTLGGNGLSGVQLRFAKKNFVFLKGCKGKSTDIRRGVVSYRIRPTIAEGTWLIDQRRHRSHLFKRGRNETRG